MTVAIEGVVLEEASAVGNVADAVVLEAASVPAVGNVAEATLVAVNICTNVGVMFIAWFQARSAAGRSFGGGSRSGPAAIMMKTPTSRPIRN